MSYWPSASQPKGSRVLMRPTPKIPATQESYHGRQEAGSWKAAIRTEVFQSFGWGSQGFLVD
jgi:hypothetical protein